MQKRENITRILVIGVVLVLSFTVLLKENDQKGEDHGLLSEEIYLMRKELEWIKENIEDARHGPELPWKSTRHNHTYSRNLSKDSQVIPLGKYELKSELHYPRILCWVLTDPKVLNKTVGVRDTWGRRCDKLLFMSSARDDSFPTIGLNVTAGRNHIASKCRAAWIYIYDHFIDEYDYFMKADPDTYIVMENLKEYLTHFSPRRAQFFGHRYNMSWGVYMAGGPGVILSNKAVRRLVTRALTHPTVSKKCIPDGQGEDWKICQCLKIAGARPVDTLDEQGRERFFVLSMGSIFRNDFPTWYRKRDRSIHGKECCSDFPIGFHYIGTNNHLVFEYFLYHVRLKFFEEGKQLW